MNEKWVQAHRIAADIFIDNLVARHEFGMILIGKHPVAFHTGIAADDLLRHNGSFTRLFFFDDMKKMRSLDHGRVDIEAAAVCHNIACAFDVSRVKNGGHESRTFGNQGNARFYD